MAKSLLAHPDLHRYARTVRCAPAGSAPPAAGITALFEDVAARIGMRQVYQPYGMTECQALCLLHDLDEPFDLRVAVGRQPRAGPGGPRGRSGHGGSLPGATARRAAVSRRVRHARLLQEAGGDGRRLHAATAGSARATWPYRTRAGHTFFKGRLRETLRISHHMVAPGEIEAFLMSHPAVEQAFVVGVPDPATNEAPVAYVILRPDARLAEEELRGFCRGRIASFKIPRVVRFVADVPRTPGPHGDKVQKGKLREQALAELGLPRRDGGAPRGASSTAWPVPRPPPAAARPRRWPRPRARPW